MMSVMSATENNTGRFSYDEQLEDMHNLGDLFTPQELPFDESFGQDLEQFGGLLDLDGVQSGGNTPNRQTSTPASAAGGDKRPPLARRGRSNPFYSPSRQIANLVQKKKVSKAMKREGSNASLSMIPLTRFESQRQQQEITPPESEGRIEDAGSSDNTQTKDSSS